MQGIKFGETYLPLEHVYCTKCNIGNKLLWSLEKDLPIPNECGGCYPYDPEDSRPLYLRKNYKEKLGMKG